MATYDSIFGLLTGINMAFISTLGGIIYLAHDYTRNPFLVLNCSQSRTISVTVSVKNSKQLYGAVFLNSDWK